MSSVSRALAAYRSGLASTEVFEKQKTSQYLPEGLSYKQKQALLLKKRADEAKIQQLKGIFVAFDTNSDGYLDFDGLSSALLALGINPTPELVSKFQVSENDNLSDAPKAIPEDDADPVFVGVDTFVRVVSGLSQDNVESSESLILDLFHLMAAGEAESDVLALGTFTGDKASEASTTVLRRIEDLASTSAGRVPLSTLLHVLVETQGSSTTLTLDEVTDLLRLTGVLTAASAADPRTLYSLEVDIRALVKHLSLPL